MDVEWVTFDTQQARHVLRDEIVHHVSPVKPKGLSATLKTWEPAARILRSGNFDAVVSTGAAVALPFLANARQRSIDAHYIESAARSEGPSMTGRIVRYLPNIHLYTQYPAWSCDRWQFRGSVFDGFRPGPKRTPSIDKVVVTLGTQGDFGFERAVSAIRRVLSSICAPTVLWQTGATDVTRFGIRGFVTVPTAELRQAIGEADLVVGHAGVGTALMSLEAGRSPLLLPRRRSHNEHTDDHQLQIVAELERRGLALGREPDDISTEHLFAAASSTIDEVPDPSMFELSDRTDVTKKS
jgi:UDP-N-acetylglucosamine transferase subunit ALG13